MTVNAWDDTYANQIGIMLNKATNIADQEGVAIYRCFDIHFNYDLNSGYPISTARKVEFSEIKEEIDNIIKGLTKDTIDSLCDSLINHEHIIVKLDLDTNCTLRFEKAKGVLTLLVDTVDQYIVHTPEEVAKFGLFLMVVGRTVDVKNLALQINYDFCRMYGDEVADLSALLTKETYEAPTIAFKKGTSLYDYDPSYITIRNYHYSE